MKEQVIEREIARLKHELAKQADGSLFDLKHESDYRAGSGKWLGRKDAMPSGTQRARYQKLAAAKPKLKAIARKLRRSR